MTFTLLYIYIFYLGFILYAGCQNAIADRAWGVIIPALPVILTVGLMDILFNQTIGRLMFWDNTFTLTFSQRLTLHWLDLDWRGSLARDIGNALDHILPHHIH